MAYAPRMNILEAERIKIVTVSLLVVGRGRGGLAETGFFEMLGRWELEMFRYRYFHTTRNGRINMSACYFLMELWGRMRYAPTLTHEKGACFLFVVGRGRGGLAGMDFFYLLGRWKLQMFRCRYFHITRDGWINMSACYFLMELWGRMRYAPTLTDEKGASFLSAVGRGWGGLAGAGFFYL